MAAGRAVLESRPDVILYIFLTVNKTVDERAKQLGAEHLMKPVMADELLRMVAQFAPPAQPSADD